MGQSWLEFQECLAAHDNVFEPLRELMQWHFADAERIKLAERPVPGYERRPTIGLRPSNCRETRPSQSGPAGRRLVIAGRMTLLTRIASDGCASTR